MPNLIDYAFLSEREGGRKLDGYVPNPRGSKSGVTVATGFDLGQRRRSELVALGLPHRLVEQLEPYLGAKRRAATELLAERPLRITAGDALVIDRAFKHRFVSQIASDYGASHFNTKKTAFFDLPSEAQTVIASVAFQYGDLSSAAPRFWRAVCQQDWRGAVAELRNFGDDYGSRRHLEADLLGAIVTTSTAELAR